MMTRQRFLEFGGLWGEGDISIHLLNISRLSNSAWLLLFISWNIFTFVGLLTHGLHTKCGKSLCESDFPITSSAMVRSTVLLSI